jgi:hypothetical protein
MSHFIKTGFPFTRGLKKELLHISAVGVFALVIFYFLRPFGLNRVKDLLLLGFAVVSILAASIFTVFSHIYYNFFLRDSNWTIGHEIIRSLLYLAFIATCIMIYGDVVEIFRINVSNFFICQFYTLLIGFVPVTIRTILLRNWRLKIDLQEAIKMTEYLGRRKISTDEKIIRLESPFSSRILEVSNHSISYIEAAQNYIIVVLSYDKTNKKEIIRLTMKEAHHQINDPLIVFCHRSYMVNLRKVRRITSQSTSSGLILEDTDMVIPLSNSYRDAIKKELLGI